MNRIKRHVSLFIRHIQKRIRKKKEIPTLKEWGNQQDRLPAYQPKPNKLLIVRLDEIGDYILWRNCLSFYKQSPGWRHHHITLLGNQAWKSLFQFADSDTVDEAFWLDKNEYIKSGTYRITVWTYLREQGFTTVVCPTRIRNLWFDDFCTLATGSSDTFANHYTYPEAYYNKAIAGLYKKQYDDQQICHEFFFNITFNNWLCHTDFRLGRPEFDASLFERKETDYILCYIGASKKSRRIATDTWIELIKEIRQNRLQKIILAGGPGEKKLAQAIADHCPVDTNITGLVSLPDMVHYTAFADAVITGDTMESHMAVACQVPVVIVANGNTFARFSEYKCAGIRGVETVYTKPFMRAWKKKNYALFLNYAAVSDDIKTIRTQDILQALHTVNPQL